MMNEVDLDKNGTIEFDEFLHLMVKDSAEIDNEDDIREAFRMFDTDGNGEISKEEFKRTMSKLGEMLTDEQVDKLVAEVDINGDGNIDFEEFKIIMKKF